MAKPICIYHGNCADGFTAAWAVWKRFGDAFDYHAGIYQDPPPDVSRREVLLVDFSYKRDVMLALARQAEAVLVLDHHKSAAEDLAADTIYIVELLTCGENPSASWERFQDLKTEDWASNCVVARIYTLFDMDRSGAGITWDFFHPGTPRPKLIDYVEDRDLWRFKLKFSREISAYIFSMMYTFPNWDHIAEGLENDFDRIENQGAAIERKHHKDVAELVGALRHEMVIGGQWVPVANLPYTLTSDAGQALCFPYQSPQLQGEIVTPPFAACYLDTADGRVFSLRSIAGGADVSEVAKQYGGGGHKHAAGFRLPHGVSP